MKFFLILLFVVSFNCKAKLSVLWWNIGYNEYSKPSEKYLRYSNLEETFLDFNWERFDVIALGEFIDRAMKKESLEKVKEVFPYQKIIKYNQFYEKSIYILSKKKLTLKVEDLDWVNPYYAVSKQQAYRKEQVQKHGSMGNFKRKYIRLRVSENYMSYNFVFYHFNNPWALYAKEGKKLKLFMNSYSGDRILL